MNDCQPKVPIIIAEHDILEVARVVAQHYSTSVHIAGDLWEFGQFFEGGGSLEEYCARMTTGYLSQHYLMNPHVVDINNYVPISLDDLKIKITKEYVDELKNFVKYLKEDFEQ